jgi:hypothetical protein
MINVQLHRGRQMSKIMLEDRACYVMLPRTIIHRPVRSIVLVMLIFSVYYRVSENGAIVCSYDTITFFSTCIRIVISFY